MKRTNNNKVGRAGFLLSTHKFALALTVWVVTVNAFAQQVPPSSTDPGRLRERFDIQPPVDKPLEQPETKKPQGAVLPDSMRAVRVTLKAVRIEGATAISGETLQAGVESWLGREISGEDILELASSLTAIYRNAGYILSMVIVPPQTLEEGVLTLRVVEGFIDHVTIQADDGVSAGVRARLAALGEKIHASRPLAATALERYLLIANEFPGIGLRSVLSPSRTPGAADLTLIASVRKLEGFASLDNYGSRYLGPGQFTLGVMANQLLAINDQWRFIGVGTGNSEMAYGQLSYSQVVGAEGLKLSVAASSARTQPGDVLRQFDVRGNADTVSLGASYPLVKTRNQSLTLRAVYDHSDVHTDILGTRVIEDRIRALRLGAGWRVLDSLDGQNTLDIDFSQGLGGTQEADLLKSRVGAKGVFNKLTFDYERSQPAGSHFSVVMGAGGQWANTPLLSSEQYAMGGRRFGRAYEPAELVGERALAFRVEPRYLGTLNAPGLRSYQLFGFYDIGRVWKLGRPTPGVPASQSLASAGFGLRLFLEKNVFAVVEAAWPLTKPLASSPASSGKDMRVLGSLVLRF